MRWVCPSCRREFGRNKQSHDCAPAMTLEAYFDAAGPAHEKPIVDVVLAFLEGLGPVHVEPVSVGIFVKSDRKVCELRPKQKWVALAFPWPGRIDHARIARTMAGSANVTWHAVNLGTPADFDETVQAWLAEVYDRATDGP